MKEGKIQYKTGESEIVLKKNFQKVLLVITKHIHKLIFVYKEKYINPQVELI